VLSNETKMNTVHCP